MKEIKIAVLVSGGGTNLQALINAQGKVIKSGRIGLVLSDNPSAYALTRAKEAGISCEAINRKDLALRLLFIFLTKAVSHPSYGFYQIGAEFATQVHDVYVYGALVADEVVAPDAAQ